MNDKTAQYVKMAKQHLDRVMVGVLWLLALVLIYVWYAEATQGEPQVNPAPPLRLEDTVASNPRIKQYQALLEPQKLESFPTIVAVRTFNMFDHKSVKDREAIEREANQTYAQAEAAQAAGRTQEAVALLRRTLEQFPTHQKARELLDKLQPSTGDATTTPPAA